MIARRLFALLAVVGGLSYAPGPAYAVGEPLPATLTGVTVADGSLSATVAIEAGTSVVAIDPRSLQVRIGEAPVEASVEQARSRSTYLAIDTSESLRREDFDAVKVAVRAFLATVPVDVQVGVAQIATTASVKLEPTKDHARVQQVVDSLRPKGNTALFAAVVLAAEALTSAPERNILLFTDGRDTTSGDVGITEQTALAAVRKNGVRVDVVALQTPQLDFNALRALSRVGGGEVVTVGDAAGLDRAFSAIGVAFTNQVRFSVPVRAGAGKQTVTVTGRASGRPFTARTGFTPPASGAAPAVKSTTPTPSAAAAPQADVAPRTQSWALPAALALVFVGLLVLALALAAPSLRTERQKRVTAIEFYTRGQMRAARESRSAAHRAGLSDQLVGAGERFMAGRDSTPKTMRLLEQADLPWRAGEWLVLRIVAVITSIAVFLLIFGENKFLALLLGLVVGVALPAALLRFLAARRRRKFEAELPDILSLIATSLSTGFSLQQALDSVARDAPQPAAKEFSRALAEARIGSEIDVALDHLADRMDSEAMRWATMSVRIQREVGGNLAETLRTTTKTLRERTALKLHVRALSAEGRLSAYILIAMPILLLLYSIKANYEYVSLLWTTLYGLLMSFVGVIAMVIGVFWMRKVVRIEV